MNPLLLTHAAAVVAEWFAARRSPRDAMATMPQVRTLPAAARAVVARIAARTLASQRRLTFACGADSPLAELSPRARAELLVTADALHAGELVAVAAAQRLRGLGLGTFAIQTADAVERRIAAIADPLQRLALQHSLPDWLAAQFVAAFGAGAADLLTALAQPAPRTLRANLLRVPSRQVLAQSLAELGIVTTQASWSAWGLHVHGDADLFDTQLYRQGAFEQQDEASQLGVLAVAPPPRGRVLDLCAGSGGKTLALAAMLGNRGAILATDVNARRLSLLRGRLVRAGVDNAQVLPLPAHGWPEPVAAFAARAERIFIDAPCSGTGSWRRRPEARWSLQESDLAELMRTQDHLLDTAALRLQPGGRLIYATCSLLPAENEQRIAALRERSPELEVVRLAELLGAKAAAPMSDSTGTFLSLRPDQHGCDGFFAAVLRRPRTRLRE